MAQSNPAECRLATKPRRRMTIALRTQYWRIQYDRRCLCSVAIHGTLAWIRARLQSQRGFALNPEPACV